MEIEGSVFSNRLISYTLMFALCLALLTVFSGCATPLESAAIRGDLDTVRTLIENGADVNEKGGDSHTALYYAASSGQPEVVRLLIEKGADVEGKGSGWTPLVGAAYYGRANTVRVLLDAGADVHGRGDNPLEWSVRRGHTEVTRLLIDAGADINENYLNIAQKRGYTIIAGMLERALGERYGVSIGSVPGAASGISAKEYFSQGIDYFRSGDYQQSMRSFTRAIKLSPNSAGAYNNRGLTYKNMGQYDRAIADFNKALELNPNSVEAYNNRGLTYNNMGQYDQAIKDYRVAARLGDEIAQRFLRSRGIDW